MARPTIEADLRERRCHVCGRRFIPAPQHVYHKNGKWCCKWSCYTKLLDEIEANKKKTGRPEGYSPKKKKGTFASAAGGRESEQKGCGLLLGEADNGNRQRKKKGEEI